MAIKDALHQSIIVTSMFYVGVYSPLSMAASIDTETSTDTLSSPDSLSFASSAAVLEPTAKRLPSSPQASSVSLSSVPSLPVPSSLQPMLVGVFVNGEEVGSLDALYDASPRQDSHSEGHQNNAKRSEKNDTDNKQNQNNRYYLSLSTLEALTGIRFTEKETSTPPMDGRISDNMLNAHNGYQVHTPIGDTELSGSQVIKYQNRYQKQPTNESYVALTTLKRFGINAEYHQQDLAIKLNMGWQPKKTAIDATADGQLTNRAIDYYPSKFGLLGLTFDSIFTASEAVDRRSRSLGAGGLNGSNLNGSNLNGSNLNNQKIADTTINRNTSAVIGAYGYGLEGVWGINARGYESENDQNLKGDSKGFAETSIKGVSKPPWNWDDWQIDNIYWAKSGAQFATRLGVNQPHALGQGVRTSGAKFTGAMLAYSNRDINRHLAQSNDSSSSLLQNTSQDYQNLTGVGEAGGVAELRINGRAIARVQIGLDGRYEFLNLDVNQLNLTDTLVEVAIYAYPLAPQPLQIRPVSLGERRSNVATGEWLIEAGAGQEGNLFANRLNKSSRNSTHPNDSDFAAHIYAEYGVNNRVALRGGVNTSKQAYNSDDSELAWHLGTNIAPSARSNVDLSYAHAPTQDSWQAQVDYHKRKFRLNYQYQARQYDADEYSVSSRQSGLNSLNRGAKNLDRRQQLLLNYRPNEDTTVSFNQYYNELDSAINDDGYYNYTSINHRFNDSLDTGVTWHSRDDRYSYHLLWNERNNLSDVANHDERDDYRHSTVGLSGSNNSHTLTLTHYLNNRTSLGQSIGYLRGGSHLLYQGEVSHRFDFNSFEHRQSRGLGSNRIDGNKLDGNRLDGNRLDGNKSDLGLHFGSLSALRSQLNIGYSLYDNQLGWRGNWQLSHANGVSASIGYEHNYVGGVPLSHVSDGALISQHAPLINRNVEPWAQENYLYAKLSFGMFKAPKRPLQFGRLPLQRTGSVIVDIEHPTEPAIDADSIRFTLDKQKVDATLLGSQATRSQYLINYVQAGEYTLAMDAQNLPIEYSTERLATPRIRVSNYAPTPVPIHLQKTFGLSGKLADEQQGVTIAIYRGEAATQDNLIDTISTGSYGYFQMFGLPSDSYILKAEGYEPMSIIIEDDIVMQVILEPTLTPFAKP